MTAQKLPIIESLNENKESQYSHRKRLRNCIILCVYCEQKKGFKCFLLRLGMIMVNDWLASGVRRFSLT